MKFKLRADKEDWLMFGGFALFLLYFTAIGIVNLATFAETGELAGFNPFPAFSSKYIVATIVLYLLILGGIFVSVGSYFFEREKGIGITTEKKDKGYSRWAKEKEIKEELERVEIKQKNSKAAGVPLVLNENEMWVDNSEYHSLVIGATGSGKTQTVILPLVHSLAKARESMIITDPKGEIYEKTSNMLRERGYQILLLNFRDPQNGSAWNPLTLPYKLYKAGNHDKAIELLDDLALNILYDESNKNADPFWEKTSADYFSGVALGLFEDAKPEEININSISLATTTGEEKFGGSTYIKEYFGAKDPASAAAINASSTIMAPNETKGSILSVFKQKVKLFASRDNLSEMLSYSSVDLESIGERPTAVFIVIQDEKKTYHSLVTILLKQIYETLISVAQKHGGKLPVRTNFLLDEFANMPPLKDVTTMITAARSRAIRFTMIIQNFAQLDSVYGKEDAETIRGNCGNIIYLITTELKALEEISKMCGEVKSKKDDKTASTPLVTVSDLQRMKQFEVIILRIRKQPFKTKFTPYYKLDWGKKYPPAKYPTRKKHEVQTFDIKEFVKNQKKKKLLEMMNSSDPNKNVAAKDKPQEFAPRSFGKSPFGGSSVYEPSNDVSDFLSRPVPSFDKKESPMSPFDKKESPMSPFDKKEQLMSPVERKTHPLPIERPMPDFLSEPKVNKESQTTPFSPRQEKELPPMDFPAMDFPPKASPAPINDDFGFDVDDLVKKIDAKIAQLEEEERRSKEETAKAEKEKTEIKPIASLQELSPFNNTPKENKPVESPSLDWDNLPLEANNITKTVPKNDITQQAAATSIDLTDDNDDDFFDDFFDN